MRPVLPTGMPESMLRTTRNGREQRTGLLVPARCVDERMEPLDAGIACDATTAGW